MQTIQDGQATAASEEELSPDCTITFLSQKPTSSEIARTKSVAVTSIIRGPDIIDAQHVKGTVQQQANGELPQRLLVEWRNRGVARDYAGWFASITDNIPVYTHQGLRNSLAAQWRRDFCEPGKNWLDTYYAVEVFGPIIASNQHKDALYNEYLQLVGMMDQVFDPEENAHYMVGWGFRIDQMGGQGSNISLKDLLDPRSIRSKLEALCSAFNVSGVLSYCIDGARRWIGQLYSLVAALLVPPHGKHGSLKALMVWFICAILASVSADHVTHQEAAASGGVNGEATASYCHHKLGCIQFTLAVAAGVFALAGVCCRHSLRVCAQRIRARWGVPSTSDNGAVLPDFRIPGADARPRRAMCSFVIFFWWTGDVRRTLHLR